MNVRIMATLLLSCSTLASAVDHCPRTSANNEWSAQCFEGGGEQRRVKPAFLGRLDVDAFGRTTILIAAPRELVAVGRDGRILIPGIRHVGDFDYPDTPQGIGRFDAAVRMGGGGEKRRCGYFLAKELRVLVEARFDQCAPFNERLALACTDCRSYCTETECQDSILLGGQGFLLRRDGAVEKTYALPAPSEACPGAAAPRISTLAGGAMLLKCPARAADPFGKP